MKGKPRCLNPECMDWNQSPDPYICQFCGFDPEENKRRKVLIREKGLTPDKWGARRLILK